MDLLPVTTSPKLPRFTAGCKQDDSLLVCSSASLAVLPRLEPSLRQLGGSESSASLPLVSAESPGSYTLFAAVSQPVGSARKVVVHLPVTALEVALYKGI